MKFFVNRNIVIVLLITLSCNKKMNPSAASTSLTHAWFVGTGGSDMGTGALNTPFASIGYALKKALPGDTVFVRAGTYYEMIDFPVSGNAGQPVVLMAYRGERPIINGANFTPTGWTALVSFNGVRYAVLDGFDICNYISYTGSADVEGISVKGNAHDITIKNCHIYNIKNNAPLSAGRSGHAILAIGNGTAAINDLVITDCVIHDTYTGTSENITLAGNIDGFQISRDTLYDIENIGIIVAGGDNLNPAGNVATNYARNGVVCNNVLYNVSMSNSVTTWGTGNYGAIAIYVCGGAGTIVEANKVYNCDRGIGLVSESNIYATRDCIVRNNFVSRCWRTGIYIGDYLNFTGVGTKHCSVLNNTLFQNDRALGAFGEWEGELRLTEHCDSNMFVNNLVYASDTDLFVHKYTKTGSANMIDHNLYFTTGKPAWNWQTVNGISFNTLADWQIASGQDGKSIYGTDPLLVNITSQPDLHIRLGSPVINAGIVLPNGLNGLTDIDGHPRVVNNSVNIGAQQ